MVSPEVDLVERIRTGSLRLDDLSFGAVGELLTMIQGGDLRHVDDEDFRAEMADAHRDCLPSLPVVIGQTDTRAAT
jgi:hypothetical protein